LDAINQNRRLKSNIQATLGVFNGSWMIRLTEPLWRVDGAEHLESLDAPRGLIVAANHRTFFDLYTLSAYMVNNFPHLIQRIYCPVRANFFYNRPVGIFVNLALSGGSMWPPIFRDERGPEFNAAGLAQLASEMCRGSLVGLHPEGKRSTEDPYTLLPAKPGLGILLEACHPDTLVMPFFTLGLPGGLVELVRRSRQPAGQRGTLVSLRFGEPLRAGDVANDRTPLAATEYVMARIHELGQADKEMRKRVARMKPRVASPQVNTT
jgi:1-acyl-sn-glycerol-3-phosphate acyltransferase